MQSTSEILAAPAARRAKAAPTKPESSNADRLADIQAKGDAEIAAIDAQIAEAETRLFDLDCASDESELAVNEAINVNGDVAGAKAASAKALDAWDTADRRLRILKRQRNEISDRLADNLESAKYAELERLATVRVTAAAAIAAAVKSFGGAVISMREATRAMYALAPARDGDNPLDDMAGDGVVRAGIDVELVKAGVFWSIANSDEIARRDRDEGITARIGESNRHLLARAGGLA